MGRTPAVRRDEEQPCDGLASEDEARSEVPTPEGQTPAAHLLGGEVPKCGAMSEERPPEERMSEARMSEARMSEARMSEARMSEARMSEARAPEARAPSRGRTPWMCPDEQLSSQGLVPDEQQSSDGLASEEEGHSELNPSGGLASAGPPSEWRAATRLLVGHGAKGAQRSEKRSMAVRPRAVGPPMERARVEGAPTGLPRLRSRASAESASELPAVPKRALQEPASQKRAVPKRASRKRAWRLRTLKERSVPGRALQEPASIAPR